MNQRVKQPPLPPEERIKAMTAIMVKARRAKLDLGEILVCALHAAASQLGSVEALVAGRPGSWEADIVRRLASAPVGSEDVKRYARYTSKLTPLFIEMGKAGEDGGDVLSQAMGPAVDELGGLAEFAGDSTYWYHDLINIGRQYSNHWDDDIY
jgi:hypothetical protein